MTQVEKIARALDAWGSQNGAAGYPPNFWEAAAVVVLKIMREPSTELLLRTYAGRSRLNNGDFLRSLIDAAIAEASS